MDESNTPFGSSTATAGQGVTGSAHASVDRVSSAAHQKVDQLAAGAASVADRFSEQTRWVAEAPTKALDYSKTWVQEKPMQAIGTALALGFIVGRLTAR